MNRKEWEEQVFNSDLNPTARVICLAIGSHGNWEKTQNVWPTRQRISGMTGASRETVGQYMTALEEQGWLKVAGMKKDNVRIYELSTPQVVESTGILAKTKRGNKTQFKNQVVYTADEVVGTLDKQVVYTNDEVVYSLDSNLPRTYQENLKEEPTTTFTDADAPVHVPPNSRIREEVPTSIDRQQMLTTFLNWKRTVSADDDLVSNVKDKTLDPRWQPHEARPNFRIDLAVKELNLERSSV